MEFIEVDALKVCDTGVKNKWRFAWLSESDEQGFSIGTWCRKINKVGICYCIVCNTTLTYGSNGKKALFKHSRQSSHQKLMRAQKFTQALPGVKPLVANTSIADRIADQKAAVTAFLSEKSLPFSLAPDLVALSKFLAKDKSALSKLQFSRTSATYINTHGTAKCLKEDLIAKLKDNFFSLNIDEGTTNAMDKIINIFVRFYDDEQNMVVTDHLASRKANISTSKNIFEHVSDVLTESGLNYSQVISCLLDNCNTMRGCKSGVERLMRNENPNLLDIHGDTVHIVHNSAKTFFNHFDGYMEGISSDLYYDIQDSPKAKELFSEIQTLLNYDKVLHIIRFIDNRFVQLFTVCERLHKLHDALKIFYFAFLSPERKEAENYVLNNIYAERKISPEQQNLIKEAQDFLSKQNLTNANVERKERILSILFSNEDRYFFLLQFYRGILMQFNSYIKQFQHEKPMLHVVHEEMYSLCRKFLSYYIKPEFLPNNVKGMLELNYKNSKIQYEDKYLNFGKFVVKGMLDSQNSVWAKKFITNLRDAYANTTKYLLNKLPLQNKALTWFSALNPCLRKKSTTLKAFEKLADSLPQVISDKALLLEEIREYTTDTKIDDLEEICVFSESLKKSRIDLNWWSHVFNIQHEGILKYQLLPVFVKALLTPFSGPLVEGSFNIMDDIITEDRSVLTVENYEAISTIKYHLRRKNLKAIDLKPSPNMRKAIHTAHASYQRHLLEKKQKNLLKQAVVKDSAISTSSSAVAILCSLPKEDSIRKKESQKKVSSKKNDHVIIPSTSSSAAAIYCSLPKEDSTEKEESLKVIASKSDCIIPSTSSSAASTYCLPTKEVKTGKDESQKKSSHVKNIIHRPANNKDYAASTSNLVVPISCTLPQEDNIAKKESLQVKSLSIKPVETKVKKSAKRVRSSAITNFFSPRTE